MNAKSAERARAESIARDHNEREALHAMSNALATLQKGDKITTINAQLNEREALLAIAEAAKAIRQEFSASLSSGLRAKLDAALETLAALQKGDK